eukprot:6485842-Amphidinium_carterae.2
MLQTSGGSIRSDKTTKQIIGFSLYIQNCSTTHYWCCMKNLTPQDEQLFRSVGYNTQLELAGANSGQHWNNSLVQK